MSRTDANRGLLTASLAAALAASLLPAASTSAASQPAQGRGATPGPPENLQVLPQTTTRQQLTAIMQGMSQALGVECSHCHIEGADGRNDFPSDGKAAKSVARAMMRMTMGINQTVATDVTKDRPVATRVECVTCHRGVAIPKQIGEILARTAAERGMTAALAEYKELKQRYYGAQAYDFSETGLLGAAQVSMSRPDDALAFLRMNAELFPRSARTYVAMAQAQALKNDTAGAIKSLEQALTFDPQNVAARRQLDQLKR